MTTNNRTIVENALLMYILSTVSVPPGGWVDRDDPLVLDGEAYGTMGATNPANELKKILDLPLMYDKYELIQQPDGTYKSVRVGEYQRGVVGDKVLQVFDSHWMATASGVLWADFYEKISLSLHKYDFSPNFFAQTLAEGGGVMTAAGVPNKNHAGYITPWTMLMGDCLVNFGGKREWGEWHDVPRMETYGNYPRIASDMMNEYRTCYPLSRLKLIGEQALVNYISSYSEFFNLDMKSLDLDDEYSHVRGAGGADVRVISLLQKMFSIKLNNPVCVILRDLYTNSATAARIRAAMPSFIPGINNPRVMANAYHRYNNHLILQPAGFTLANKTRGKVYVLDCNDMKYKAFPVKYNGSVVPQYAVLEYMGKGSDDQLQYSLFADGAAKNPALWDNKYIQKKRNQTGLVGPASCDQNKGYESSHYDIPIIEHGNGLNQHYAALIKCGTPGLYGYMLQEANSSGLTLASMWAYLMRTKASYLYPNDKYIQGLKAAMASEGSTDIQRSKSTAFRNSYSLVTDTFGKIMEDYKNLARSGSSSTVVQKLFSKTNNLLR